MAPYYIEIGGSYSELKEPTQIILRDDGGVMIIPEKGDTDSIEVKVQGLAVCKVMKGEEIFGDDKKFHPISPPSDLVFESPFGRKAIVIFSEKPIGKK